MRKNRGYKATLVAANTSSSLVDDVVAPIFLPALFVVLGAKGLFFTVAHSLDATRTYASLFQ
jgi:hypothetical protein